MIFRSKTKFPICSWAGRFSGETAFIIGNGPSLLENNLDLIKNYFTIGINRAFRVLLPKILIWQDESLYEDCYEDIVKLPCCKVTLEKIDPEDIFTHFELSEGSYSFNKNPYLLKGKGSTAALAVQLSVSLGFSSIVLLGCDCNYQDGKTDFYGENKNHTVNTLRNFSNAMEWVKKECTVPVYNCGNAPFWPRISLEEAIEKTNPKEKFHIEWINSLC